MMNRVTIGICGGTGSGKTTLAENLMKAFGDRAVLLSMDYYYRKIEGKTYEERCQVNYDHPDALDIPLMTEHIRALKNGETVEVPQYDFTIHNRSDKTLILESRPLLIVEGILLFTDPVLTDLMDIRVFVDTDADVRILRRAQRDMAERGRSIESVINQYLDTVKPMHELFVEPSRAKAHVVVPGGGRDPVPLEMLIRTIEGRLEDE